MDSNANVIATDANATADANANANANANATQNKKQKLIKGKKTSVDAMLLKHQWHTYLKQYRIDHAQEHKGQSMRHILKAASAAYTPTHCSHCKRSY